MEQSWQFRAANRGYAICPTCSAPHFPFCPVQNSPRIIDYNVHHFPQRHPGVMPGQIADDAFRPYQTPPLQRDHLPVPASELSFDSSRSSGDAFSKEESLQPGIINKRIKLEKFSCGRFLGIPLYPVDDQGSNCSNKERQLNLIRDHGGHPVPMPYPHHDFPHIDERRTGNNCQSTLAAAERFDYYKYSAGVSPTLPSDSRYSFSPFQSAHENYKFSRAAMTDVKSSGSGGREMIDELNPQKIYNEQLLFRPPVCHQVQVGGSNARSLFEHGHVAKGLPFEGVRQNINSSAPGRQTHYVPENDYSCNLISEHMQLVPRSDTRSDFQFHVPDGSNEPLGKPHTWNLCMQDGGSGGHGQAVISHGHGSHMSDIQSVFPPLPPHPHPGNKQHQHLPNSRAVALSLSAPLHVQTSMANHAFPVQSSPSVKTCRSPPLLSESQILFKDSQFSHSSSKNFGEGEISPLKQVHSDIWKAINAAHLFKQPHRKTRPSHIVIILRGLPGSGKSYLAKVLRDLEVNSGCKAPRIHSMDDYFMTEVEKIEEIDGSGSSLGTGKRKKQTSKKIMEYCYEPEMEEAYRSSMLKAFKKTLEEGSFTFIIVDDRNLRVADFAQFWASAKMSGFEVYLLEAAYKDPAGCAARNVHGFTLDDIQKMADKWEQAPSFYMRLDVQSLFHGDKLNEQSIQEVDMDMDEMTCDETSMGEDKLTDKIAPTTVGSLTTVVAFNAGESWASNEDETPEEMKELRKSKWSEDVDVVLENVDISGGHSSALTGLIQTYKKGSKSVYWGDQVGERGFSIGALKKSDKSLVIGPGAGYNLDSNPVPEEEIVDEAVRSANNEQKNRAVFLEQLRAERESSKAIFDRRRQRIGLEDEYE